MLAGELGEVGELGLVVREFIDVPMKIPITTDRMATVTDQALNT